MSNENSNIKLSICIATYNRVDYIGETLDSMISQISRNVEILVVDGASTDNTDEVVGRYVRKCPQLRYVRLPIKGGVDQDYAKAVELASGEYCWLMTDDDLLKPGAVDKILEAISRKYGLIIVNAEVRDVEMDKILEKRRLKLDTDRIYKPSDSELFFIDTADYLTFIGCVVIKKTLWNEREKTKYYGSLFVHVGVIFQKQILDDILVVSTPLISIRYANAQWKSRGFEIWMSKWPSLVWSFNGYSDSAKNKVCLRHPWKNMKILMLYRGIGAYTDKEYNVWIKSGLEFGWKKLLAKIIAFVPGYLINSFCFAYLSVFRRQSGLTLVDLKSSPYFLFSYHG